MKNRSHKPAQRDETVRKPKELVSWLNLRGEKEKRLRLKLEFCFWVQEMSRKMRARAGQYQEMAKRQNMDYNISSLWHILDCFEANLTNEFYREVRQVQKLQTARGDDRLAKLGFL
jgi:hypothetical protein